MYRIVMSCAFVAVLTIVILLGFLSIDDPQYSVKKEQETIRIATSQTGLLIWIALEKGFFKKNGINVSVEQVGGGTAAMDKVLNGTADFSASSEFTLVSNSFKQVNLQVVGIVSTANTIGLTVRKDHGIAQLTDLYGKKIGVTLGSAGEFFLRRFLAFHNLSVEHIQLIAMKPEQIYQGLVHGNIDAGFSWEPNNFNLKKSIEDNSKYYPGQNNQDFHFILTGRTQWIASHQTAIKSMLNALIQAEKFTRNNKAQAQALLNKRFNTTPEFLQYLWSKHDLTVSLPQSLLTVMDDAAKWRAGTKKLTEKDIPDYFEFISFTALEQVRPESVTIIH